MSLYYCFTETPVSLPTTVVQPVHTHQQTSTLHIHLHPLLSTRRPSPRRPPPRRPPPMRRNGPKRRRPRRCSHRRGGRLRRRGRYGRGRGWLGGDGYRGRDWGGRGGQRLVGCPGPCRRGGGACYDCCEGRGWVGCGGGRCGRGGGLGCCRVGGQGGDAGCYGGRGEGGGGGCGGAGREGGDAGYYGWGGGCCRGDYGGAAGGRCYHGCATAGGRRARLARVAGVVDERVEDALGDLAEAEVVREDALVVVVGKGAGVAGGGRDGAAALGPGEGVGAVRVQGGALPLAAAGAEDVELPVRGVGFGCGEDGVGGSRVGLGKGVAAVIVIKVRWWYSDGGVTAVGLTWPSETMRLQCCRLPKRCSGGSWSCYRPRLDPPIPSSTLAR